MSRIATHLQWLAIAVLSLGAAGLALRRPASLLVLALIGVTALTLGRGRSLRERRLVALLQLLAAGLLAAVGAGSWLTQATVVLALAGLVALELDERTDWWLLLRRCLQATLVLLPLGFLLSLLLPLLGSLLPLPLQLGGATGVTGLSPVLDAGGIAELATSDAVAARVAFAGNGPPPPDQRYWRVLVHERFDGRRWTAVPSGAGERRRGDDSGSGAPGPGRELWVEEPDGLAMLPWSGQGLPRGETLRISANGELLTPHRSRRRRIYVIGEGPKPPAWRRRAPAARRRGPVEGERSPRLEALAARWARMERPQERLLAAEHWFRSQPFRYTRQPGTLPQRAPLDAFLFERREGFCAHYASAFTALMRDAGVPARVVSGYRGGVWVHPPGGEGFLELRRRDAHAWSEVWLPEQGWVRIDPSAWVAGGGAMVDVPPSRQGQLAEPLRWLRELWWDLDLRWTGRWLGFREHAPAPPLGPWMARSLPLLTMLLGLGGLAALLRWLPRFDAGRGRHDPVRRELDLWLALWARRGMEPLGGESLRGFAARLEQRWPELGEEITPFVLLYEQVRYATAATGGSRPRRRLASARRALGRRLRRLHR